MHLSTSQLIEQVITQIAPEELGTYRLAERRYLKVAADAVANPGRVGAAAAGCADDPMGFGPGIDLASVLTGAVAYVCTALAQSVVGGATDHLRDAAWGRTLTALRRIRRRPPAIGTGRTWTDEDLRVIHATAVAKGGEYGLDEAQATRIADAVTRALRAEPGEEPVGATSTEQT